MDINSLKSFIAVAQSQSFSLAADTLNITQPAVSKRIANLEKTMNCLLFDRIGHRVQLTQAGNVLFPKAKHIILAMENCIQDMKNLENSVSGTLKLGLSHYIGLLRIPSMLNEFSRQHPAVSLDIHFYDSENAQYDVLQGNVDIAVVTLPETLAAPHDYQDLKSTLIWNDELVFIAHKNHPLHIKKTRNISLHTLAKYPAILPNLNTYTGKIVKQHFDDAGVALQASHPTNNLENIKVLIATGFMSDHWSVLPATMLNEKQLLRIHIEQFKLIRKLGCLTSIKRSQSNANKAFIHALTKYKSCE